MIQRACINMSGRTSLGKTAFVEALLAAADGPILVARCVQDDRLRCARESSPRGQPELQRYRPAGADAAAVFTFPNDADPFDLYETRLMTNYSRTVILGG